MRLAHLQKATTCSLAGLACAWAVPALKDGRIGAALGGALLILLLYALVLGAEFLLLRLVHGDDPTPRANAGQLLAAWWGEVLAAPRVFCWQQPFRSRLWPDHLPLQAGGRRGVLLIHGFVCNRGVWNPWLARLQADGVPFVALDLEPVFCSIDEYVLPIERAVLRLEQATGRAPVVVAHSMGGLALRRWWAECGDATRVHHAITLGSPHHGTWLARFAFSHNGRQMQLHAGWLRSLVERERTRTRPAMTCFYSHCDNIVFPPSTAMLDGADNRHLDGVAHVHMVTRPEPWNELMLRLRD